MEGAHTEMCALAGKKKRAHNCVTKKLFISVPLEKVLPDTLHLFIRIADQLFYLIITEFAEIGQPHQIDT